MEPVFAPTLTPEAPQNHFHETFHGEQKVNPQFKDQTLERADKEGIPQVAKDLSLAESLLYSWRKQRNQCGSSMENQKLQQAELARLKRENTRLSEENAFLKKAGQIQPTVTITPPWKAGITALKWKQFMESDL
mgnify:CR=1 FL=1